MKGIYKFECDLSNNPKYGIFVADSKEIDTLNNLKIISLNRLGEQVALYYSRPHYDIIHVTSNPAIVEVFLASNMSTGYNPLNYKDEEDFDGILT